MTIDDILRIDAKIRNGYVNSDKWVFLEPEESMELIQEIYRLRQEIYRLRQVIANVQRAINKELTL